MAGVVLGSMNVHSASEAFSSDAKDGKSQRGLRDDCDFLGR